MISRLKQAITKYSSFIFIAAIILAVMVPNIAKLFHPMLIYFLMALLLLGFVKIDFSIMAREIKEWPYHLYLLALSALIIPTINYFITLGITHWFHLPSSFTLGALLIYTAPTAAATPTLCLILHGRLERAMLNVVVTSLLAPLTMPLLFYFLVGQTIELPLIKLFAFIGMVILLPFIAAILIRKATPKLHQKVLPNIQPLSILLLFLLMFGASSVLHHLLFKSSFLVLEGVLLTTGLFLFTFILGWLLSLKKSHEEKITVAMVSSWTNLGLAIVVANQFFQQAHPQVIFLVIIATVIWNLGIVFAKLIPAKLLR